MKSKRSFGPILSPVWFHKTKQGFFFVSNDEDLFLPASLEYFETFLYFSNGYYNAALWLLNYPKWTEDFPTDSGSLKSSFVEPENPSNGHISQPNTLSPDCLIFNSIASAMC